MLVEPYMKALSATVGQEVTLDNGRSIAFSLEGRSLLLEWNEESGSFVAYVEVGPLLGWNDGEVCRELLSSNFMLLETQGAALSYDEVNNVVALNRMIPVYGLEPEIFIQILDRLLALAEVWKDRLLNLMAKQEEAALANAAQLRELSGNAVETVSESAFMLRI